MQTYFIAYKIADNQNRQIRHNKYIGIKLHPFSPFEFIFWYFS